MRLVSAAESGDAAAEAELCRRYLPAIRIFAARRLRTPAAVDDFVQDALLLFVEALRSKSIQEPEHVGAFVLGTCRNMSRHRARLTERRCELWDKFGPRVDEAHASINEPLMERARLEDCVSQLTRRARRMLHLAFFEGMSGPEVGAQMEMTDGNARVLRHRTLASLRECLKDTRLSYEKAARAS